MRGERGEKWRQTVEGLPTILLVDDVAMFRDLGRVLLARSGRVVTARSATECLERAHRERPAVIVADLHMPEMDGAALCRAVKDDPALGDVPVVIVAGSGDPHDHARAVRAGADDVLTKPLSRLALVATVNRFVRFAAVRGLPRVPVALPVAVRVDHEEHRGVIHNLSRGGAFIAPERPLGLEPRMEMELRFRLPHSDRELAPKGQIVWERRSPGSAPRGVGVRFLGLDRRATREIEEYVVENAEEGTRMDQAVVVNS